MYEAQARLYRGKTIDFEQMGRMNAKIPPMVVDNFRAQLKLKDTRPLSDLVFEVVKSEAFRAKRTQTIKDVEDSFKPKPPPTKEQLKQEIKKLEALTQEEEEEEFEEEEEEEMEEEDEEEDYL